MPRRPDAVITSNQDLLKARYRQPSPSRPSRCMSRGELAYAVNDWLHAAGVLDADVDANYVGKLERGLHRWPRQVRRDAFRAVLGATRDAELGFHVVRDTDTVGIASPQAAAPCQSAVSNSPACYRSIGPGSAGPAIGVSGQRHAAGCVRAMSSAGRASVAELMTVRLEVAAPAVDLRLHAPAGRFFPGLAVAAQVHPAVVDGGRVEVSVPTGFGDDPFVRRPRRGLVVGRADADDAQHLFGLDSRHARRRLAGLPAGARLLMPSAYRLDELTFAVLWAVVNLDEALLADDGLLEELRQELASYHAVSRSAVSRDFAGDLSDVGRMWLGSAFCAEHIRRHAVALSDVPVFWTREQRGEEASTWLLFAHKHNYLRATAEQFGTGGGELRRVFCIPDASVAASPTGERVLLLLAATLMESYGIQIVVTTEPEYATIPGFATDRQRRAIVANWIGADGVWHVDVTDHRARVAEYLDATRHAAAHSITAAAQTVQRLQALCSYLDLGWCWVRHRCRELADHGLAGVAQPRSRHLSIAGVDRACRYLASLPTAR